MQNPELVAKASNGVCVSSRKGRVLKTFLVSSTAVWLLFWLAALDLALRYGKPLKHVQIGALVLQDGNSVRNKFERLNQPWFNPDVLMIGSSLSREMFALADAYVLHTRPPLIGYELNVYGKSIYLEDKLQQLTGKKHTALDLSVGGCMASDTYFLLKSALELRPNIRLLVLPLAPRDFVDNFSSEDPEKSAVNTLLRKKSLSTIFSPRATINERFESVLSSFWYYFDTRADYERILQSLTCQLFNRSATLHGAAHFEDPNAIDNHVFFHPPRKRAEEVLPTAAKEAHAKTDARQYNPYNSSRLKLQFQYMDKTLSLCREKAYRLR